MIAIAMGIALAALWFGVAFYLVFFIFYDEFGDWEDE